MTEAERYEKKTVKCNTKRNPQQEWIDIVQRCVSAAPPHLRSYMETMAGLDNIPRKEKPFLNFTSNSLNLRGSSNKRIVDEIWNCLKQEREKRTAEREKHQAVQKELKQTQQQEERKQEQSKDENTEPKLTTEVHDIKSDKDKTPSIDTKKVHKAMKKALKKAPNRSMKIKELRKLLGNELGLPKSAKKSLQKALTSNKKVKVDGKIISLS
jgi:hypothetical protein